MSFVLSIPIRFGQCDPAGILYYPRYFDLFHQTMEAWFDEVLGLPYAVFLDAHKLGVPSVHAQATYKAPTTYGETVQVALEVHRIGRTSIVFGYTVRGPDGEVRCEGEVVTVIMDLDPARETFRRAVPVPDDLRARIEAFRGGPPQP